MNRSAISASIVAAAAFCGFVSHTVTSRNWSTYHDKVIEATEMERVRTGTDAFVIGACNGNLAGCNRRIEVTATDLNQDMSSGQATVKTFYIEKGLIYDSPHFGAQKSSEALLPTACTGVIVNRRLITGTIPADYKSTACKVIDPAAPNENPAHEPPGN